LRGGIIHYYFDVRGLQDYTLALAQDRRKFQKSERKKDLSFTFRKLSLVLSQGKVTFQPVCLGSGHANLSEK
jgi:hypothetical protein